jgi:phosphoribosylanthranilate isomerase
MKEDINLLECCRDYKSASALLLDTFSEKLKGGTGKVFDWKKIPKKLSLPIIIAGGLNSENISDLIKTVRPFCVDVSGSIESIKGVKDEEKMKEFMIGVNDATL